MNIQEELPAWVQSPPDAANPKLFSSYQKAAKADTTPLSVNTENGSAEFIGRHGHYITSLSGCPCGSYPKPCKHMYRLAMELGFMSASVDSNYAKMANRLGAFETGISSKELRAVLESLDDDARHFLLRVVRDCSGEAGSNFRMFPRIPAVDRLVSLGLLMDAGNRCAEVKPSCNREEIRKALISAGVSVPDRQLKKGWHWSKTWAYLQSLYDSQPELMQNLFAIVDGTPLSYDRTFLMHSALDPNSRERIQERNLQGGCL